MKQLEGRVAIVTGAGGGIGQAICSVFEEQGAQVLPVDLQGDHCFHADIGTEAGNQAMIHEAMSRYGRLDTLILNAGIQFLAPIPEFPESEWDRLHNVMLKGPFFAVQHAWPYLTAKRGGRIVFTVSTNAWQAEAFKAGYNSAKAGVIGLMNTAALEGADYGLTANGVAPGSVYTPLAERQIAKDMELNNQTRDEVVARWLRRMPGHRFIDPREIAHVIAFLASDAASAVNGVCMPVDLGLTINDA